MNARVEIRQPLSPAVVSDHVRVDIARSLDDVMQAMAVRAVVYMGEQFCPYAEEFDGNDFAASTHLIARIGREPVGVMRVRWFADFAKVERFTILREHRGGAVPRALMDAACDLAARKGYRRVLAHVQVRLAPFLVRVGRVRVRPGRPRFFFSDHEYLEVERKLSPPPEAITIDSDPLILLRPEGAWDRPGVLDRSTLRPATNPH